jgi:uridine kinase
LVSPAAVVIVEGSHLLCAPAVAAAFDLRVYLDTPDDVRFIRRLLRDQAERGRTARSVVDQYLATVRPAHHRLIGPSRTRADVVIADVTTTVDRPDPAAIARLAAPLLQHPLFKALRNASHPSSVSPGRVPGARGAADKS